MAGGSGVGPLGSVHGNCLRRSAIRIRQRDTHWKWMSASRAEVLAPVLAHDDAKLAWRLPEFQRLTDEDHSRREAPRVL